LNRPTILYIPFTAFLQTGGFVPLNH